LTFKSHSSAIDSVIIRQHLVAKLSAYGILVTVTVEGQLF